MSPMLAAAYNTLWLAYPKVVLAERHVNSGVPDEYVGLLEICQPFPGIGRGNEIHVCDMISLHKSRFANLVQESQVLVNRRVDSCDRISAVQ